MWILVMVTIGYGGSIDHWSMASKESCLRALNESFDKAATRTGSYCVNSDTGEVITVVKP